MSNHEAETKPDGGASVSTAGLGSLYAPGSPDAVTHGCTCPTMDNGHGKGCGYTSSESPGDPLYWFDYACKLHGHNKSIPPETMCYEMPNVEVTGLAAASLPQGPCGLPGSTIQEET